MHKIIYYYYKMPKSQSLEAEYAKKEQQIYEEFEKLKIKDKQIYEKVEAKRVKAIHKKLSVLERKREKVTENMESIDCEIYGLQRQLIFG